MGWGVGHSGALSPPTTASSPLPSPPSPSPPALSPSPGRREAEGHLAPSREASPRFLDGVDETRQGKGGDTA